MLVLKCPKHPRYNGTVSPRAACDPCIALWEIRMKAEVRRVIVVEKKAKVQNERVKD